MNKAPANDLHVASPVASHVAFLDGLRGLAALYVLLHHVWLTAFPRTAGQPACSICRNGPAVLDWLQFGHLAVVVFIVVSGVSLALSPARSGMRLPGGFWAYIRRRGVRILPPYWIALLLSSAIVAAFTGRYTGVAVDAKAVVVHGLLLNNVIDSAKPNGTFWSIAVEWQIYFTFPLMLLVCRRQGIRGLVALAGATSVLVYLLGRHHAWLAAEWGLAPGALALLSKLLHLTPQFLALFAFGVAAAAVSQRHSSNEVVRWSSTAVGAAMLTLLVLVLVPTSVIEQQFFWVDLLVGAVTAALLAMAISNPTWPPVRALEAPGPRWLGQSCYSLYLIHAPLLELAYFWGIAPLNLDPVMTFVALLVLVVPATLLLSRGFWWAFELPFIRRSATRQPGARVASPPPMTG